MLYFQLNFVYTGSVTIMMVLSTDPERDPAGPWLAPMAGESLPNRE